MTGTPAPAPAGGLAAVARDQHHRFTSFDGVAVSYQVWGPDTGTVPVVLNHGFAVTTELNWVATGVLARLLGAGRTVVGVDARGHGRSDTPHDPARYGEDAMARDVAGLLDHLGVERVDVVGYSMGAIVSLVLAVGDERLRSLVVGGVGSSVVLRGGVDTGVLSNLDLVDALLAEDPASVADPGLAAFRTMADLAGSDRAALAAAAQVVRSGPLALDRITARTLVIAGTEDPLAAAPEVLAGAIPGARLLTLPGDHVGVVAAPAFADAVVGFLEEGGPA